MAKTPLVLGYTRSGKPVLEPSRGAPDTNNIDTYHRTKRKFSGWTRGDHMDASQMLIDHGERNVGTKVGTWSTRWASVHWDIGGRWLASEVK